MICLGKLKVFVKPITANGKNFNSFSGCITKKNKDESFTSLYIKLNFKKDDKSVETLVPNKVHTIYVEEGYLTIDSYKNKEDKEVVSPLLFINKFALLESKDLSKKE